MAIHFHRTTPFEENRVRIEDFIYRSILEIQKDIEAAIRGVDNFAKAIDKFIDTLEQMYQTPGPKDMLSEKSSPIGDGRYRVFYKVSVRANNDFDITMLDIDDNRESNLDRFPVHRLRTFVSDED
jgi:hypothetical protein